MSRRSWEEEEELPGFPVRCLLTVPFEQFQGLRFEEVSIRVTYHPSPRKFLNINSQGFIKTTY